MAKKLAFQNFNTVPHKNKNSCPTDFFFGGAKGGNSPVGRTEARDPTAKPEVGRGLLGKGDLGPAAGAVPMRTACVRGTPSICDAMVIRGIIHHAAVARIPRKRLFRSQEETVQGRVAAPRDLPGAFAVEMLPCPLGILALRLCRSVAAPKALGHL